jgi:predicted nucleic acid-binding protein
MADAERVFCDTSVVIRYFTGDDPPRAYAAAGIIDSDTELVVSTGVVLEIVHALRTDYGLANPLIATLLIDFLTRDNVTVPDADRASLVIARFCPPDPRRDHRRCRGACRLRRHRHLRRSPRFTFRAGPAHLTARAAGSRLGAAPTAASSGR